VLKYLKYFAVPFLLALSLEASAGYLNGSKLLNICEQDRKACGLYIMGVADTHDIFVMWKDIEGYSCIPKDVTDTQLSTVVIKYLKDHPENLHLGAAGAILTAITKAWPCG